MRYGLPRFIVNRRKLRAVLLAAIFLLPAAAARSQGLPVDLALVLAIDCSYSVDDREYNLQIGGLADAFRSPGVIDAIQSGPFSSISVAVVQWSSQASQYTAVSWTRLDTTGSILQFADRMATMPRLADDGSTAMAAAIFYSSSLQRVNPYFASRRVIDVSADGRNNNGPNIGGARDLAIARGITVNGLAIVQEDETLDRYFERDVIGGPGAFVIEANDYGDYARAIKRKLIREIQYIPISRLDYLDTQYIDGKNG